MDIARVQKTWWLSVQPVEPIYSTGRVAVSPATGSDRPYSSSAPAGSFGQWAGEGVGLSSSRRKALKINGRIRLYVVQDYHTGVPLGKRDVLGSGPVSEKRSAVATTRMSR